MGWDHDDCAGHLYARQEARQNDIPAARYGSEAVTSTTDLLHSVDKDSAAVADLELAVRLHQSGA